MATGTITWVNASKGHAFITPDEGGRDLFVEPPRGADRSLLLPGAAVDFDARPDVKGRISATNVALRSPQPDAREHPRRAQG